MTDTVYGYRSGPRKKLSGSAALAVLGNGWSKRLYGSTCPVVRDGPDVILAADARHVPGFEHVTREKAPYGEHRRVAERLYYANLPAVVATNFQTIEEGQIHEFDADGFRIGPLGHWVWWPQVVSVGEKRR